MVGMSRQELREMVDEAIDQSPTIVRMQGDISVLKQDVEVLKQDVAVLKQDVAVIKQDVAVLKEEMHKLGIMQEEIRDTLITFIEAVTPLLKNSADMKEFDQTLKDQGDQIKLTQTALKGHVNNKSIHVCETE